MDLRALRYFVVVAEERNIGRAAARLHMTQPPLSRAIRQLETELGVALFDRAPSGVEPTAAGHVLFDEARSLLDHADQLRDRVYATAGEATLSVGTLADTAELMSTRLVAAFRTVHPHVAVTIRETDLADPSAGLRSGRVDVALTRAPFDTTALRTHVLATEPVGMVVRTDDPLADRPSVTVADLDHRRWVRLPEGIDPTWTAYWTGPARDAADHVTVRTIQECVQSVLWNGTSALAPLDQVLPPGLRTVPVDDRPPSQLLLAWPSAGTTPLIRSFVRIAAESYRARV